MRASFVASVLHARRRAAARAAVGLSLVASAACLGACTEHTPLPIADGGDEASAPADAGCAASELCNCVREGGVYRCGGNAVVPACPFALSIGASCDYDGGAPCFDCQQGAGATCSCKNFGGATGDGGPTWLCVGSGTACTGS